ARFGGYVEISPALAVLSLSPELFLATGAGAGSSAGVVTCPIKGTRPAGADLDAFAADPKDAAELAMIVDLMRNDLGRVCRPGSVRVVEPRRFEVHPTVIHGVAEVRGELREGTDLATLLVATFPPGSVTGAPKIRAMQVIDAFEPSPRAAYCGSLGWVDDRHGLVLNVAIRTAVLRRDREASDERWEVEYHAGCGIVADSDPAAESAERRDKTAVLGQWSS
ncbi:MAG: chorismate-binding protein, partial [Phycisphaerales bacterium]